VIRAVKDVKEPHFDEVRGRLEPSGIEPHQARVAFQRIGAVGSARREELQ